MQTESGDKKNNCVYSHAGLLRVRDRDCIYPLLNNKAASDVKPKINFHPPPLPKSYMKYVEQKI